VLFRDAWLRVEAGGRPGQQLLLFRPVTAIGLAGLSELGLEGDPDVEAIHARILRRDQDFVLADSDSYSGTFVNDRRVQGTATLHPGDMIRVGRSTLLFLRRG
jgi:hypothetical protein